LKIFETNDVKLLLNEKFNIIDEKSSYENRSKIKIECKICNIISTKTVHNKMNSECRNCNMKKSYKDNRDYKILNYPGVLSYYANDNNIVVVKFICETCNCEKEKLFPNFIKNKYCTNCIMTESSLKREKEKGCKFLRFENNILSINSELDKTQQITLTNEYDDINLKCSQCSTFETDKLWRISRFIRTQTNYTCVNCSKDNKLKFSTYNSVKFYKKYPDLGNENGYLYTYKIIVDGIISHKIGITRNNILDRIAKVSRLYQISDLKYIQTTNLECSELEKHYKNKYKEFKILPTVKFEGYTECFTIDIFTLENIEAQRLEIKSRTSEANADGSGQLILIDDEDIV
jgi:hypothetical protein